MRPARAVCALTGVVIAALLAAFAGTASHRSGDTTAPRRGVAPSPPDGGAANAAGPRGDGPYYVVVEKHYAEVDPRDDTASWFYGTVRNDGNAQGNCQVIAYYFDEDDRAIEATVVDIKPLAPGQMTTFMTRPNVQNVASAAVAFTGRCGHGRLWHYEP